MAFVKRFSHPSVSAIRGCLLLIEFRSVRGCSWAHIRMYRFAGFISSCAEFTNYPMSPVASMCCIRIVSKPFHEAVIDARSILQQPAPRRTLRPAEARERKDDEVKDRIFLIFRLQYWLHDILESSICQSLSTCKSSGPTELRLYQANREPKEAEWLPFDAA